MQSDETEERCTTLTKYIFNLGALAEVKRPFDPIRIQQALLRFHMRVDPSLSSPSKIEIAVSAKVLQNTPNDAISDSLPVGTHQVTATGGSNDWVEISVTDGLQTLFSSNAGASHLEVTLQAKLDCKDQGTETVYLANPLLVLFTDTGMDVPIDKLSFGGIEKRQTRLQPSPHAGEEEEDGSADGSTQQCLRRSLVINFQEDLGFDFILAPLNFDLGYCNGVCPPPSALRKGFLRLIQLPIRDGCCAPSGYQSLQVLLRINDTFVIGELQGLTVSACHCV